ncbi:MAG: SRPBCC domain-containing protein [Salinivirgaceae bacterium]|nr:SRPBCC domain-containing protein [Salinivirgaceae bacterium]
MIKQYFWGTEANTDWKEGSPISFSGTWEGAAYEDKGVILKIEKEKILRHSYWSSFWGTEYNVSDFSIITYELSKNGQQTTLAVTQEGFKDLQSRDHSIDNWKGILNNIKNLLEK